MNGKTGQFWRRLTTSPPRWTVNYLEHMPVPWGLMALFMPVAAHDQQNFLPQIKLWNSSTLSVFGMVGKAMTVGERFGDRCMQHAESSDYISVYWSDPISIVPVVSQRVGPKIRSAELFHSTRNHWNPVLLPIFSELFRSSSFDYNGVGNKYYLGNQPLGLVFSNRISRAGMAVPSW